jgi:hypothetical protein
MEVEELQVDHPLNSLDLEAFMEEMWMLTQKVQKGELLLPSASGVWNITDGTQFCKRAIVNALELRSKEQSQVMGIFQGPSGQDVGGNFRKLLKRWRALYPPNKTLLEINAKFNNARLSTNS